MNDSWFRRSNGTSSGSSSIGTQGLFGNGSFDAMMPFNTDFSFFVNNKNNNKPSVKLLPLSNRRTSSLANNNLTPDSGSFFFNGTPSEDTFFPLDRGQNSFVASSEFAEPARTEITLQNVVVKEQLINFAMDRHGVKFLEIHYPTDANNDLHRAVFEKLTESMSLFGGLCKNSNGNFIIQKLVEFATLDEQKVLLQRMVECGLADMCKDKFACRVVQIAVQKFDRSVVTDLIKALHSSDLVDICTDQTSIHAMQRIVRHLPVDIWTFFVEFLYSGDNLMAVCRDKYGCRLVQQVIDRLSENSKAPCFNARLQLLHTLMSCVVRNCYRLSSNEFANYVVQYAIKSSGIMEMYRDMIIDKCLLRNLLSMSQDKYASHVIEGAFIFAPPSLLTEMMTEIFDGYVKDHGTNRDALDILLFHQYGNYVVQQMITICTSALMGKEERRLSPSDLGMYAAWYEKIRCRVERHSSRLERFSSGKKIIDSLQKLPSITSPKPLPPRDLSLLEMTAQLDVMFPSFLSNPLMF
ncbi:hypothetical protein L5515_003866 [Caenorhabditis briggsae]|uniref:PUM-HD domain-containing protein n=2 Tax=Caenorhabditis briggsae TaxID=6238 RepID=A0AAE9JA92_CAEBR|nr:hypothetical protein L3Y34_001013 [Caenorhabditis briggsae]UMM22881.1 hypothetical protein L5515_003866 [Caenorhabditis briggsae]